MPRRVNLTERSWPFLGSIALHVVIFEILFFPMLQPSTVMLSQAPNVLWLTPFIVPGDSGHLAGLLGQPAAAFAQQAEAPEPVSADSTEDVIADDLPAAPLAAPPATSDETGGANADAVLIQTPPKVRGEAARRLPDSTPPPRTARPLPAPPVSRKPVLPPSKPPLEELQALPAEQAGVIRVEKEHSNQEKVDRKDEEDRLSRELAAQKQALAEIARQEQLAREQAQQAIREQSERERAAAEKVRQEQETRKKLQRELRDQEEQERLSAEKARKVQRAREQQQQALREQAERKQAAAAEKARLKREAQEKLQQARRIQEEQERLAAEKVRKVQRARDQQQQALHEQTERQAAAAEKARQEREALEQQLRERKLQEEMMHRKKAEQPLEKPKRVLLALAEKKPENPIPKSSENRIEKPSASQPQKGLVLPHLKGDLKLVATGSTLPNMTMTFKDFPLSRRNRPFSRAEARHEKSITPLVATTQENSREVVIEKTTPGVYTITVAPVSGKADVDFSLKLYEGSSRAIVRTLGRHALAGTKVVFKILMPEGILWQDDKAFTGSMEDSDSITKFSAGTGLVWKEYNN